MLIGIQKQSKPLFMYLRENTTEAYLEILFRSNSSSTETIPLINKQSKSIGWGLYNASFTENYSRTD